MSRVLVRLLVAVIVASVVGVAAWIGMALEVGDGLRAHLLDGFFPSGPRSNEVVVIAVDRTFGARTDVDPNTAYAALIEAVRRVNARSAIIDPDLLGVAEIQTASARVSVSFEASLAPLLQRLGNVVLAIPKARTSPPPAGSAIPVLEPAVPSSLLADAAVATGVAEVSSASPESVTRTVPLAVWIVNRALPAKSGGRASTEIVPSVSLIGFLRAEHLAPTLIERRRGIDVDGEFIPTEANQRLRVSYTRALLDHGSGIVSAADLVDGRVPPARLRGKTLVVGLTDPRYARLVPAPAGVSGQLPPVLVQANALNTLLTRHFLTPTSDTAMLLTVVGLAFVVALLVMALPLWLAPIPAISVGLGYWLFVANRFKHGHLLDLLYPLVAAVAAFVAATAWRIIDELARRRRVSKIFARYVPASVAKELTESDRAAVAAAGQRLNVAVLFCDLRGFTPVAARLEPHDVRALLDCYYERASRIILDHDGTVLRFVGDEVIGVFGAPLPQPGHIRVALLCARDLLAAAPALHAELAAKGLPPVEYGIGLHAGDVIAADIGSSAHRQYDLIGDTVNVGSRLCNHAQRSELIFSQQVMSEADPQISAELLGPVELKGVGSRIIAYRISAELVPHVRGIDVTSEQNAP
jgi:adenylate cyclase